MKARIEQGSALSRNSSRGGCGTCSGRLLAISFCHMFALLRDQAGSSEMAG